MENLTILSESNSCAIQLDKILNEIDLTIKL